MFNAFFTDQHCKILWNNALFKENLEGLSTSSRKLKEKELVQILSHKLMVELELKAVICIQNVYCVEK